MSAELRLLQEQLSTLLSQGEWDTEEAVEIAALAGMLERAGSKGHWTERARAWRDGKGRTLIDEGLDEIDSDGLLTAMADVAGEAEQLEDAVDDFDETLVAAWWAGRSPDWAPVSALAAELVRTIPSAFSDLSTFASDLLSQPGAADGPWLFWEAVAEAASLEDPAPPEDASERDAV